MTNFGEARFTISADNQALPEIEKTEKALTRLGSQYAKVAAQIAASFKAATNASDMRPMLLQVEKALGSVQTQAQTLEKTFKELARINPLTAVEGAFDKKQLLLPAGIDEFLDLVKELSTTDPFAFLIRGGASVTEALDAVMNRVRQLKDEEKLLLGVIREVQNEPLIGPGFQLILDRAQAELQDTQERLERLGRVSEASGRPAGQLTDGTEPISPIEVDAAVQQHMEDLFAGVQKVDDEIAAANEHMRGFVNTENQAVVKAQELARTLAASANVSGLKPANLPADQFAPQMKTAREATAALSKEVNNLEREFTELRALTAKGAIDPAIGKRMGEIKDRANELGVTLGKSRKELDNFGKEPGGGKIAAFLRNMSGSFDRFGQSIEDATGIAESDFAILLGAGLAGGFAGVIRITQKLVGALLELAAAEKELFRQTNLTFGPDQSQQIRSFADAQTSLFGTASNELQELANQAGVYGIQLGLSGQATADFAQSMASLADILARTTPGINTTAQAMDLMRSAASGDVGALRQLGLSLTELNTRAVEKFGLPLAQLDEMQRLALLVGQNFGVTAGEVEKAAARIDPAMRTFNEAMDDLQDFGGDVVFEFQRQIGLVIQGIILLVSQAADLVNSLLNEVITGINVIIKGINLINPVKDIPEIPKLDEDNVERYAENVEKATRAQEELEAATRKTLKAEKDLGEQAEKNALEEFRNSKDKQNQALDAQRALAEAIFDGNRRIEEAEERLRRTREDNARKYRDLIIQNERAIVDAVTRVEAAQLELTDNLNDAQDRVEDAIDRIADAKKENFRSLRDIDERIEDKERDHARKVEDQQRKIAKAHKDTANAIFEAQLDIEAALRRGSSSAFNAAQRALSDARIGKDSAEDELSALREQEDFEREIGRLRRDRRETELDGIEKLKRARRDLARAERDNEVLIAKAKLQVAQAEREEERAREDAIRALNDLEIEQNRALRDARRALEEAEIARDRAVEGAIRAFERLADTFRLTVDEIIAELMRLGVWTNAQSQITGSAEVFFPPGNAAGGPVYAGQVGWVGERGPELFVPNTNGQIISNEDIRALVAAMQKRGGPGAVGGNTVNVYESSDPRATAFAVSARLARGVNN